MTKKPAQLHSPMGYLSGANSTFWMIDKDCSVIHEVLRVPNFVVSGGTMHPALPCTSSGFLLIVDNLHANSINIQLDTLASNAIGGERDSAFEKLFGTTLTAIGGTRSITLRYHMLDEPVATEHSIVLRVTDRVCTSSNYLPKSCLDFGDGTLLSLVDPDGGQASVDLIYNSHKLCYLSKPRLGTADKPRFLQEQSETGSPSQLSNSLVAHRTIGSKSRSIEPISNILSLKTQSFVRRKGLPEMFMTL